MADLPDGVHISPLHPHRDQRGSVNEVFREEWDIDVAPVQWNVMTSVAGSLRGVHVHASHTDYVTVADGACVVGLRDVRASSSTAGLACVLTMTGDQPEGLVIPPGVAHGFLHQRDTLMLLGMSETFDPGDQLACRWDDPSLEIDWPTAPTILSAKDAAAPTMATMISDLAERASL
jgi:dTDP-4-dehydrorhamnose 3,5-epimerase